MHPGESAAFRVALITAHDDDRELRHLIRKIAAVPGVTLAGVLRGRTAGSNIARLRKYRARHGSASLAFNVFYHVVSAIASLPSAALAALYRRLHTVQPTPTLDPLVGEFGARVIKVGRFSDPAAIAALRALDADLGVVWGTPLLKPELFNVPRLGCVNIHLAALPRYRGAGDVGLSEVLDGLSEVGVTVHRIDVGLDTGAILGTGSIAVEPYDTLRSLHVKAVLTAHRVCADVVARLSRGAADDGLPAGTEAHFPLRRSLDRLTLLRRTRQFRLRQRPPSRGRWMMLRDAAAALFLFATWLRRLVTRRRADEAVVLTYHLVCDRGHWLGVSTDEFINHLEHLSRYYRVGSLDDVVAVARSASDSPPVAALTFDDGYAQNAGVGHALCGLYEVPYAIFVCGNAADGCIELPRPGPGGSPSMTPGELRMLATEGVEIGSHTLSHADCGDPANWPEIAESRVRLESALGKPVRFFSFPYGEPENCPIGARPLIVAAGYQAAFTAFGGSIAAGDDLFRLNRALVPRVGGSVRLEAAVQGWLPGRMFRRVSNTYPAGKQACPP